MPTQWIRVFFIFSSLYGACCANSTSTLLMTTSGADATHASTLYFTTTTIPIETTSYVPEMSCGDPPTVSYSQWTKTNDTIANYSCTGSRFMSGPTVVRCTNSTWSAAPQCLQMECLPAPRPIHSDYYRRRRYHFYDDDLPWQYRYGSGGLYSTWHRYRSRQRRWYEQYNETSIGHVMTYTCGSGYEMIGSVTSTTCQANLTWTPLDLECKAKNCGAPVEVENGNITSVTGTTIGGVVTYECLPGSYMETRLSVYKSNHPYFSYEVQCQTSGNWANLPSCLPFECGESPTVQHASKRVIGSNLYRDIVIYECSHDHQLIGNNTITCREDAKWSPEPSCKKFSCPEAPKDVPNGSLIFITSHNFGGQAGYQCMRGYRTEKSATIICMQNGSWTSRPECKPIDCGVPPSIHFGSRKFSSTTFDSNTTYTCEDEFKIIGINYIRCGVNGLWEESPLCEPTDGQVQWRRIPQLVSSSRTDLTSSELMLILSVVFILLSILLIILFIALLKVYGLGCMSSTPCCISGSVILTKRGSPATKDNMDRPFVLEEEEL